MGLARDCVSGASGGRNYVRVGDGRADGSVPVGWLSGRGCCVGARDGRAEEEILGLVVAARLTRTAHIAVPIEPTCAGKPRRWRRPKLRKKLPGLSSPLHLPVCIRGYCRESLRTAIAV